MRLTGLSSGAKVELIKISKSPSVVSVALQVPELEGEGVPNNRMTDKFPSTTSIWQILRKFESAAAGGLGLQKNFTGRGVPQTTDGDAGAGRLHYETPVISYMSREVSDFVGLQQSLGQLGFTSGTALLRLSFRATEDPLEVAQQDIEEYFKSVEQEGADSKGAHAGSVATSSSIPDIAQPALTEEEAGTISPPEPVSPPPSNSDPKPPSSSAGYDEVVASSSITEPNREQTSSYAPLSATTNPVSERILAGPGQRPVTIIAPSSSSTPRAAQQAFNENDYTPTLGQAQRHQKSLQDSTHNQRLASYSEEENKQKARAQKLSEVKTLKLNIRLPDQWRVEADFSDADTAQDLYDFAAGLLVHEGAPFILKFQSAKGQEEVPRDNKKRLIADVGMVGRLLVNFLWDIGASVEARRSPILKAKYVEMAKELEVPEIQAQGVEEEMPAPASASGNAKPSGGKKGAIPKWLQKGLGKK